MKKNIRKNQQCFTSLLRWKIIEKLKKNKLPNWEIGEDENDDGGVDNGGGNDEDDEVVGDDGSVENDDEEPNL